MMTERPAGSHRPARAELFARGASAPYEHIRVDKLTPSIGAEVSGVDLDSDLSPHVFAEIERAFAENLVIFFRDQALSAERHIAFGRMFGPLHIHPAAPSEPGHPELMVIAADEHSARANGEGWHSDVSCDAEPPLGSMLYIRECPPVGGDTLFANMYAAYEALSPAMQAYVADMRAVHDGEHVYRGLYADLGVADRPKYPRSAHPVVRTHPATGRKALFVNAGFTTALVGVAPDESDAVLRQLFMHLTHPSFQCRFRWTPGSLAFWDNRCAQHHAIWDYWPARRYGNRVTIGGDVPV